ncbi:MAG: Na+/H+ antiporter subunit C [Thermodesulfobacteriota bacterium]
METVLAFVVGGLYAAGIYLMLRRSLVKLLLGLALLSHAANLLIFTVAGFHGDRPPLVPEGSEALAQPHADPLPQALILTAIVISFAVLAFGLALFHRAYREIGTDDLDRMKATDT